MQELETEKNNKKQLVVPLGLSKDLQSLGEKKNQHFIFNQKFTGVWIKYILMPVFQSDF